MQDTVTRLRRAASLMGARNLKPSPARRKAAAFMGSRRSERKTEAARKNGRLGGSPRRFAACISGKPHRWYKRRCRFCGLTKAALTLKEPKQT